MNNNCNKLKKVKINTEKGERFLVFRPAPTLPEGERIACDSVCKYGSKKCRLLRNPENPEDPDESFMDFCANLGCDDKNSDLSQYIPCENTIEENLSDIDDVYQKLIKDNGFVRITEVIDSCCSEVCPMYSKNYENCTEKNDMCILRDLLKNNNFKMSTENETE